MALVEERIGSDTCMTTKTIETDQWRVEMIGGEGVDEIQAELYDGKVDEKERDLTHRLGRLLNSLSGCEDKKIKDESKVTHKEQGGDGDLMQYDSKQVSVVRRCYEQKKTTTIRKGRSLLGLKKRNFEDEDISRIAKEYDSKGRVLRPKGENGPRHLTYDASMEFFRYFNYEELLSICDFRCEMARLLNGRYHGHSLKQGGSMSRDEEGSMERSRCAPYDVKAACVTSNRMIHFEKPKMGGNFRALVIGIGYYGAGGTRFSELEGSFEDCKNMVKLLTECFKVPLSQIVVLNDHVNKESHHEFNGVHCTELPTGSNIRFWMDWLVKGTKAKDQLFFYCAAHGIQTPDLKEEEDDGMNEEMVPLDYRLTGETIKDDYIHENLVVKVPKGCMLLAVWDCCHSETNMDLSYVALDNLTTWKVSGKDAKVFKSTRKPPEVDDDRGLFISIAASTDAGIAHEMPFPPSASRQYHRLLQSEPILSHYSPCPCRGSNKDQLSGGLSATSPASKNQGIMTTAFRRIIKENVGTAPLSFAELLRKMRHHVGTGILWAKLQNPEAEIVPQIPQLSSSHPFDLRSTLEI